MVVRKGDGAGYPAAELREDTARLIGRIGSKSLREAVAAARGALDRPQSLPSARMLATMASDFGGRHIDFVRAQAEQARSRLLGLGFAEASARRATEQAQQSIAAQRRIEQSDAMPFEVWRQAYLDPRTLQV